MEDNKKEKPERGSKQYPEIMTIDEVADYLQLHKQVVYRHVKKGTIPASRIGATIRFKKSIIDTWLTDSALETMEKTKPNPAAAPPSPFNIEED